MTDRSAAVFLALSAAADVKLVVKRELNQSEGITGQRPTIQLGSGLHVVVVEATGTLIANEGYLYDVEITTPPQPARAGTTSRLADTGLLTGGFQLGYAGGMLPRFFAPPLHRNDLRLAHSSCRKAHGPLFGGDALQILDQRIAEAPGDAWRRPHVLMLTGDQIYADDVDSTALRAVQIAARTWMPEVYSAERLRPSNLPSFAPEQVEPKMRQTFAANCGLPDDSVAESRLLSFCEFVVMYMGAWNGAMWQIARGIVPFNSFVADFFNTVPRVARLLANTPTLMMFDDHEISDDWFMDSGWRAQVCGNAGGRGILSNGLLAYAVCQDWGNRPDYYTAPNLGAYALESARVQAGETVPAIVSSDGDKIATMLDVNSKPSTTRLEWNYRLEIDGANWRLATIDTRTRRVLYAGRPPGLIDPQQLSTQLPDDMNDGRALILISPAPLFDVQRVEMMPRGAISGASLTAMRFLDAEGWLMNAEAMYSLLERLSKISLVVVLSGDVHHGYSAELELYLRATQKRTKIVQLVSSGSKYANIEYTMQKVLVPSTLPRPTAGWIGVDKPVDHRMRGRLGLIEENPPYAVRTFALTPAGPANPDSSLADVEALVAADQYAWSMRINFGADKRPLGERVLGTAPIAGTKEAQQREVVRTYNIGLVRFADLVVTHEMLWRMPRVGTVATKHVLTTVLDLNRKPPEVW